jgi:signal peptidase I
LLGAAAGLAFAARRWADVVVVRGTSMAPTLEPGDQLLVERWSLSRREPLRGEVVLAPDPRRPERELIKRVAAVSGESVELRGDGPASTDSRDFGLLPRNAIHWRVALRYWPPSRFGPLPTAVSRDTAIEFEPQGGEPACSAFGDLVVGSES